MKIKRTIDGKEMEFELTDSEIFNAFVEKQHRFDRLDCEDYLHNYFSDESWYEMMDEKQRESLIEEAARNLRRNIDVYDNSFEFAIQYAFEDAIQDIIMNEEV